MISDLPVDLVEEILSRVSVKSIRVVRSTCKNWNLISKDERFADKHIDKAASAKEKDYLMITSLWVDYLSSFTLNEIHNKNFCLSINSKAIGFPREVNIAQTFFSNGLVLCLLKGISARFLIWNPYWGKIRWIECPTYCTSQTFAFGYNKSCGSHKIMGLRRNNVDMYDLSSDSWRTLDTPFDMNIIEYVVHPLSVSLKGNTYWYTIDHDLEDIFLHCFDFTRECFGPRLPLPDQPPYSYSFGNVTVSLSSVKEEMLAVLFAPEGTLSIDIWVTNKIEPDAVSWSYFLKVEPMEHIRRFLFKNFLIDEEKKVIVVFDEFNYAYIINGESGHFRKINLIDPPYSQAYQFVGCYVPSSVKI